MSKMNHALLFIEIAQRGSISAAARELQLTRATAARRLTTLEEELGVQLVHRTTRMLSLTSAGRAYLEHVLEARDALMRAEDAALSAVSSPRGVLSLAGPSISLDTLLSPLLIAFDQEYPDIDVEMHLDVDVRSLVAQGIDVGLQVGLEHNSELIMKKMLLTEMILVASPHYVERRGAPESIEDLNAHSCLVQRGEENVLRAWELADGSSIVPAKRKLTTRSFDLLIASACQGLGLAVLPRNSVLMQLATGELVQLMPDVVTHKSWSSLVYSATRIVPPKVRAFIDFTQAFVEPMRLMGEEQ